MEEQQVEDQASSTAVFTGTDKPTAGDSQERSSAVSQPNWYIKLIPN